MTDDVMAKTDEALAEVISGTQSAVSATLEKLNEIAAQYGSEAFNVIMGAYQLEGLRGVFYGVSYGLIAAALITGTYFLAKAGGKEDADESTRKDGATYFVWGVIFGLAGAVFALIAWANLFDAWNWFALFRPEVAAAHRILGL